MRIISQIIVLFAVYSHKLFHFASHDTFKLKTGTKKRENISQIINYSIKLFNNYFYLNF